MSVTRGRDNNSGAPRSRSTSRNPAKSAGTTRSGSSFPTAIESKAYPESVTFQNPSSRLLTDPINDSDISVSTEERLSESDYELTVKDEGRVLPNFSSNETASAAKKVDDFTLMKERLMLKKAESAKVADSLLASERAISNAKAIGRTVPTEIIKSLEDKAKEAGTEIHVDPEKFYQEKIARKNKLEEYAIYKKRLISSNGNSDFIAPYTRDEEEKMDSELANVLNTKIKTSDIDSDTLNQRAIRTITRGNFFENLITENIKQPKSFVLCMDFSEESYYALEWCVGTVLVDSSVLYILNVLEDDEYSSMNLNGIQPTSSSKSLSASVSRDSPSSNRERTRINNVNDITKKITELLKFTKLQVHVVIESCHHPIPRHFIVGVIKHMSPTLVIVGSKGSSAIKGVIMGSLSNHLARKSTSPVMVVRNRLKKITKKNKFVNNVTSLRGLADARID